MSEYADVHYSSVNDLELFRNELSDTIAELNASYAQLAQVEEAHLNDITTLRTEMNEATAGFHAREQEQIAEIEQLKLSLSDKESVVARLQSQLDPVHSNQSTPDHGSQINVLQSEKEHLEKVNADLLGHCKALETKQAELLATFRQQLMDLQVDATSMCEDRTQLQAALSASQQTVVELTEQITKKDATLEKAKKAHKLWTAEKEKLHKDLNDVISKKDALHLEVESLKAQLQELTTAHAEAISGYVTRITELEDALKQLESSHNQRIAELSEQLNAASDDKSSAQATIDGLKLEIVQLKSQCDQSRGVLISNEVLTNDNTRFVVF